MPVFYLIAALCIFLPAAAWADKVAQYKPPHQFEAADDFYVIEGAGLYPTGSAQALDVKLWEHSKREDITQHLKTIQLDTKSHAVQSLVHAVLLSESNTDEMKDYDEFNPGEDLLTLRIKKLMEGGFYKDALELYTVAVETPHHADIAKVGMLAMLARGQKSIACLEMKTMGDMGTEDSFWPAMLAYCNVTLSSNPSEGDKSILSQGPYPILAKLSSDQEYSFLFTPEAFSELTMFEQHMLIAEKRIKVPELTPDYVASLSPRDIAVLLSQDAYSVEDQTDLMLAGVGWGVVSISDLEDYYSKLEKPSEILGGLPAVYKKLQSTEDIAETRAALIIALNLAHNIGDNALLPLAASFAEMDVEEIDPTHILRILRILHRADVEPSDAFIGGFLKTADKYKDNKDYLRSLEALQLMVNAPKKHEISQIIQNMGVFHKNPHTDSENVIENLDNEEPDVDNAANIYEKDVDAAVQKEHIDASKELQEELARASRAEALGETALLSIKLLSGKALTELDDSLFEINKTALEDVNLNNFSRMMAVERLIGDEEKK